MNTEELAKYLKTYFGDTNILLSDLKHLILKALPSLQNSTLNWKINQLKKLNLIFQISRGIYSFKFKPDFQPELTIKIKRLYNKIKSYSKCEIIIWDTAILQNISDIHFPKNFIFVSTDKQYLEDLFNDLLELSKPVFIQPDKETIQRYIIPQKEAVILQPSVSETPLINVDGYILPTIEGMLVNFWLKYSDFFEPLGVMKNNVFLTAFSKYNINLNKMLRYAARRDKRKEILKYLKSEGIA